MGKRLMPGKTNKSKGKKYSHRPVRATNAIWDEKLRKWFRMPVLALMMLIPINAFAAVSYTHLTLPTNREV